MNIALTRLKHLNVLGSQYSSPEKLVEVLVAIQGQDYAASKWAVGLRIPDLNEEDIESAFLDKKIVRSWPLRGTLHVVSSKDIYWLLDLLGPPTISKYAAHYKKIELDPKVLKKCYSILSKNLSNQNFLTRKEISSILEKSGIITNTTRLSHILQRAGLEGLICFGPRRDKDFTYALIEEWIPGVKNVKKPKEEALYEITKKYFDTRAPATLADFVWWSGLNVKDAKTGIESFSSKLNSFQKDDQTYYIPKKTELVDKGSDTLFLLPAFDEFLLAYTDRRDCMDPPPKRLLTPADDLFRPILVINGWVSGIWQRELKKEDIILKVNPYKPLNANLKKKLKKAAEEYAKFLGKNLILEV
ncbi:winged helix DNA-binding domain-containing protein [Leptospira dzoumogneensis]|uniref:Winged helix DNA-binding domain-containing protein n=1 Tax=Leptospira dzoumogneensis TaxID=2484904 RepID=A0A4Z1AEZ3_9LEPT|nr:winged helix DNA-binding domain-containing protein [Leptospira dzoumogneensis]TGM95502.1 winged helix DNA-binding domain-containing protein [Leptospira dzoumogneensis]